MCSDKMGSLGCGAFPYHHCVLHRAAAHRPADCGQVRGTSIHLNKTGERRYGFSPKGSRFTATNATLFALVQ